MKNKIILYIFLSCVYIINIYINIYAQDNNIKNILMIGIEKPDIPDTERKILDDKYNNYNYIIRDNISNDEIQELVKENNPAKILIKNNNTIYEYSANNNKPVNTKSYQVNTNNNYNISKDPYASYDLGYPGESYYSYLYGEGVNPPPYTYSRARQTVKELAGIAQTNYYPLSFNNFNRTNINTEGLLENAANGQKQPQLSTLGMGSNGIYSLAYPLLQWASGSFGAGATALDAYLDAKELKARRQENYRNTLPVPYNYYLQNPGAQKFYPTYPVRY